MSNVFHSFGKDKSENASNPNTGGTIAVADIMAMSPELKREIKALSKQFDAIEYVIGSLADPEPRKLQDQLRNELTIAALNLSQAIRKFTSLQVRAIPEPMQETCGSPR
jgi:hypothetical protein